MVNVSRVKENMQNIQHTFDKFRKDLMEKEQVIEEKNKEILRLRVVNNEASHTNVNM